MESPASLRWPPHPFQRSGLAPLSDLRTEQWKELFRQLEKDQSDFLAKEPEFRSPDYQWPRDSLHTWSRLWEYPYTYYHLNEACKTFPEGRAPHIVDLGSGVTFFPFSAARLGFRVTCADIDPVCATDIPRASLALRPAPGAVDVRLIEGNRLPFADGEIDAVYCVSVLEHIPSPEQTVQEIARILKPGGLFVLTIDLDLRGDSEIGVPAHQNLVAALEKHFDYKCGDTTIHPANILTSENGLLRWPYRTGVSGVLLRFKQATKWLLGRSRHPFQPFRLAVQGFVLTSRRTLP